MQKSLIIALGAALLAAVVLIFVLRPPRPDQGQQTANSLAPIAVEAPLPAALVEKRQKQMRAFLVDHDVKDAKTQRALEDYFGELQSARAQVVTSNQALMSALRAEPNAPSAAKMSPSVQQAMGRYHKAVQLYDKRRTGGEKQLAQLLGKAWTPHLRALLIGMGAIGEPSPIVSTMGVPDPTKPSTKKAPLKAKDAKAM